MLDKTTPRKPLTAGNAILPFLLRQLYVDERRPDREIAEALGVDRVTVTKWRKRWGISREDRPAVAL